MRANSCAQRSARYELEMPPVVSVERLNVSVVIPHYNSVDSLLEAVSSAEGQTVKPLEIIVVDDRSNEDVQRRLANISISSGSVPVFVIYLENNLGPGSARNAGIDRAAGDYIAFLDSDDKWLPNKLELQVGLMEANPDIFATSHAMGEAPQPVSGHRPTVLRHISEKQWLVRNRFVTSAVMLRNGAGFRFPENSRYSEDLAAWLNHDEVRSQSASIDIVLGVRRHSDASHAGLSSRLWRMELGELRALWGATFLRGRPVLRCLAAGWSLLKFARRVSTRGVSRLRILITAA